LHNIVIGAMEIYTIGYGNREINEFVRLLKTYGIETIVDVRRFPTSKFDCYKRENLQKILRKEGVYYYWIPELGGFRGGYAKFLETREFSVGLEKLIKIAKKNKTCIMCAELFPWRCHRRYIAMRLKKIGYHVMHILKSELWEEKREI